MLFTQTEVDHFLNEDTPYLDLTSWILSIDQQLGTIEFFTREDCVVSGTELVLQLFKQVGVTPISWIPSGERVTQGSALVKGKGPASALHRVWKPSQNILDHTSGIATKTAKMVSLAHEIKPELSILTTRKSFPGNKKLMMSSILAGGAFPHRLGLSETILIFKQHRAFLGNQQQFLTKLSTVKHNCCEKKY